jgi:1,4-alpha-glucan branching enzyme
MSGRNLTGLTGQVSSGMPDSELRDRVLKQLARELLLAQSSDWAFLMRTGTAREYATKRTLDHLTRFNKLHDQFAARQLDEKFLADCEWRDNLFPNLNWRYYCSGGL